MRRALAALIVLSALSFTACEDRRSPTEQAVGWFPASQRAAARCIVHYESTGKPGAVSPGGGNHGLFQINSVHRSGFERLTHKRFIPGVYDPRLNGQFAYVLWKKQGWRPWSTHRRCGV